jgi:hypothetical protein
MSSWKLVCVIKEHTGKMLINNQAGGLGLFNSFLHLNLALMFFGSLTCSLTLASLTLGQTDFRLKA